jgi:hypothetical protein
MTIKVHLDDDSIALTFYNFAAGFTKKSHKVET